MEIRRKRPGQTLPHRLTGGSGHLTLPAFDGYQVSFHCQSADGHDMLVLLERHEAVTLATFICAEMEKQRCRISEHIGAMRQLKLQGQEP